MTQKTKLSDWDRLVAPALRRIEANAHACRQRASDITSEVARLQSRPQWLTRAQAELANARKALQETLARIEAAEKAYQAIEREDDNADE